MTQGRTYKTKEKGIRRRFLIESADLHFMGQVPP